MNSPFLYTNNTNYSIDGEHSCTTKKYEILKDKLKNNYVNYVCDYVKWRRGKLPDTTERPKSRCEQMERYLLFLERMIQYNEDVSSS